MTVKSSEWQGIVALVAIIGFLGFLFLNYTSNTQSSLFDQYNQTCTNLTGALKFNESINITCDCYYENVNTGMEQLDTYTKPLCTCDCVRDGRYSRIAIRAI